MLALAGFVRREEKFPIQLSSALSQLMEIRFSLALDLKFPIQSLLEDDVLSQRFHRLYDKLQDDVSDGILVQELIDVRSHPKIELAPSVSY